MSARGCFPICVHCFIRRHPLAALVVAVFAVLAAVLR